MLNEKAPVKARAPKKENRPTGDVAKYTVARLVEGRGGRLDVGKLHADYCSWCQMHGLVAQTRKDFVAGFMKLCSVVDFETKEEAGKTYCLNMRLRDTKVAA